MKLREYKRIIFLLQRLESFFEKENQGKFSVELIKHYTDSELRDVIDWLYPKIYSKKKLQDLDRSKLIHLVNSDNNILLWTINHLESCMTGTPSYSQDTIDSFFERTQNQIHYLASKPVREWDEYDASNYRSLLIKTGTTKKVYAIFNSDVVKEDVYAVTTKPSYFFDTKEEAEKEINSIVAEGKFANEELIIHSLWLLT